jgi:TIR domain/NB-ARC domain
VLDIFICHSAADHEVAGVIRARLERGAEAKVWLDECGSHSGPTVAATWEAGLSSAAILLLLSPEAVPQRRGREDWELVLNHVERNAEPPLGAVLLRDCLFPRLLERKRFFRWTDHPRDVLRAIEQWVISLHPQSGLPAFLPARLPWFRGRERELDALWETLADDAGVVVLANDAPASGKTSLAHEFARAASGHFRDILWIECGNRSEASITCELASQLGVRIDELAEESLVRLGGLIEKHRLLVVLDDVTEETPILAPLEGRSSVLITTQSGALKLPPHVRIMQLDNAIRPTLAELSAGSVEQRLWEAISICRRHGFPLELPAQIARINESDAKAASERLAAQRWIDPLDAAGTRFRVGATSSSVKLTDADCEMLRRRHAVALNEEFAAWRAHPARCKALLAELEIGFQWAMRSDWSLATSLADRAFAFLKTEGRLPEAAQIYTQLRQAAEHKQDERVIRNCSWELSWIRDESGNLFSPVAGDQLAFRF